GGGRLAVVRPDAVDEHVETNGLPGLGLSIRSDRGDLNRRLRSPILTDAVGQRRHANGQRQSGRTRQPRRLGLMHRAAGKRDRRKQQRAEKTSLHAGSPKLPKSTWIEPVTLTSLPAWSWP